jgi:hypothetical protein
MRDNRRAVAEARMSKAARGHVHQTCRERQKSAFTALGSSTRADCCKPRIKCREKGGPLASRHNDYGFLLPLTKARKSPVMNGMLEYRTQGFNGYAVKYSPFFDSRIAVSASANFGLVGNGRLYILGLTANGIQPEKWLDGLC